MKSKASRLLYNATRCYSSAAALRKPPSLLSMADLSIAQIQTILQLSAAYKKQYKAVTAAASVISASEKPLAGKTVALMFNKRSTRTRVASESAAALLGMHPMFLGSNDIQLGVNESLRDTAKIVSSMSDGIMARVGAHEEIQTLAEHSSVPVINALCDTYHPTQILADILTMIETFSNPFLPPSVACLRGLNVAWVGDSNNILNDMILSFGRLGINLNIATPKGYELNQDVLALMKKVQKDEPGDGKLNHYHTPEEACKNADIVTTDTWISMGWEDEKEKRMADFAGFQVTMDLMKRSNARPEWKFMHCLPRKPEEVDDEVFYSNRSLVFPEAENRKWTTMAVFSLYFGRWGVE